MSGWVCSWKNAKKELLPWVWSWSLSDSTIACYVCIRQKYENQLCDITCTASMTESKNFWKRNSFLSFTGLLEHKARLQAYSNNKILSILFKTRRMLNIILMADVKYWLTNLILGEKIRTRYLKKLND